MNKYLPTYCCSNKTLLNERKLISDQTAHKIQSLFKLLSNVTRLKMLHALVIDGELRASDLSRKVGMKPQAVSNQLQKLVDRRVLSQRRNGANIYYSISDPCVIGLLDQGLCLVEDSETNLEHEKHDETE